MSRLEDYWAETRATIESEYRFGSTDNYCSVVAKHIAEILCNDGEKPSIARLQHPHMLIPLIYEGRIRWQWHEVCTAGDLAYDPIHELPPMVFENYVAVTFLQPEHIQTSHKPYEPSGE